MNFWVRKIYLLERKFHVPLKLETHYSTIPLMLSGFYSFFSKNLEPESYQMSRNVVTKSSLRGYSGCRSLVDQST